jgi:hypothetical protein
MGHLIQGILAYMNRRERSKIFLFCHSLQRLSERNILQRTQTLLYISHLPKVHTDIYMLSI